jgi:DNA-binding beta-propeller fold protein YncE
VDGGFNGFGSVTELSASTGALVRVIDDPIYKFAYLAGITSSGGHIWVANGIGNSVTELSAATGALVRVIHGSSYGFNDPWQIASDGTHIWVANSHNSVTELSAATGALVRRIGGSDYGRGGLWDVASDGTHVWVLSYDCAVTELLASNGALIRRIQIPGWFDGCDSVTIGASHMWVTSGPWGNAVAELSLATGALVRVIEGASYEFKGTCGATLFGGDIWVVNYSDNSVTELSATTGALVRVIRGSK